MSPVPREQALPSSLWSSALVPAAAGSGATILSVFIYTRYFRRIPTSEAVRLSMIGKRKWIKGIVTSVGDSDNFRLYHTPGIFWGPFMRLRRVPTTSKQLQNATIHIRLAGVDAPEAAHFGRPSQPYSAEALAWLKSTIEGKHVYCQLVRRDQYSRIVANVHLLPRILPSLFFTGKNLSLEMIHAGWGTTYLQAGAEYGNIGKDGFLKAEETAKTARIGMWEKGTKIETPAEYKKRYREGGGAKNGSNPDSSKSIEKRNSWFLSNWFRRN